jgi:hypothetical protein
MEILKHLRDILDTVKQLSVCDMTQAHVHQRNVMLEKADADIQEGFFTRSVTELDTNEHRLKCFYTNADSLPNKRSELELRACLAKPDIICITEVSPKKSDTKVEDAEIQIPGYTVHSNLKECKRGVAILTSDRLNAVQLHLATSTESFEEQCWISVRLNESEELLVGCIYRSPNSNEENNTKPRDNRET